MGNLQVMKASRMSGSSVLGLWYVTGWGKRCLVLSFLYVSNFEIMFLEFIPVG